MGRIVELSAPGLDAFMYGDNSNLVGGYIQQQLSYIPQAYNAFSDRMRNALVKSYDFVTSIGTKSRIQSELRSNNLNVLDNYIMPLTSLSDFQQANYTMQRWVMSHPKVKEYYDNQDLDGYSSTYDGDYFGKGYGDNDYNYRRVMDGVVQDEDDHIVITHYYEDLMPGDSELEWHDRVSILHTYDAIDWMLEVSDIDFTINSDDPPKINGHKVKRK